MLIPRNVLEVHHLTSNDSQRPNLQCVHAEREADRPRLTATDGHRLITVTWAEPDVPAGEVPADYGDLTKVPGFTANLLAETCAEIARIVPRAAGGDVYRHAWLEEANGNGLVRMGAGDKSICQAVQCEAKDPEIDFPEYRQVLSSVKGAVRIGINAKYLAEVVSLASKISGEVGVVLSVPADPMQPLGVHVDSKDGIIHVDAVIMPMRIDLSGRPDWEDVPSFQGMEPPPKPPEEPTADGAAKPRKRVDFVFHTDRTCTECGAKGTADNGFCLDCIGKRMRDPLFKQAARQHAEKASGADAPAAD